MTSLNDEARKSVLDTLDALRQWRNEIDAANDRCLTKAIDRMAAAQRAMGWPDHVSTGDSVALAGRMHYFLLFTAVRDALQKASKLQTDVIDKVAEACFASRLIWILRSAILPLNEGPFEETFPAGTLLWYGIKTKEWVWPHDSSSSSFNKIKQCRRVATRYDKLAANYLAFVQLASIRLWLRVNEYTAASMIKVR